MNWCEDPTCYLIKIMQTVLQKMCHGFSRKFHGIYYHKSTAVWFGSKSTPHSMTSPCHLPRFYLFSMEMLEHDMDFGQVQVMEFPWHLLRKWWDFHRIWSHFQPNRRQKDEEIRVTFFTGKTSLFPRFPSIPIPNVTRILMEIPCHSMSQINGSLVQIHTKIHSYSM